MKEELVVIDYSVGSVFIYDISTSTDVNNFLKKHNHNSDECSWMWSSHIQVYDNRE